ncbi:hypothetical protein [Microbacterium imperiale]|uniref:hypothetical protein n=1 Tax=Microbacterium imperiale TaxID=33884 RepID=UPI001AE5CEE6|nr:hypothetical protein [Microbacterium imperiale]MBP2422190.1 hypothetical protein [Microbacterium imperiale]MDS0200679.1 hypothetical protein [Microbacterium imperiale]
MEQPGVLQIVADVALPSAAIIISTVVAVWLARSERKAAAAARADERTDAAFVRTLVALSTLNTINLRAESASEPFRELRVGLTLLAAVTPERTDDLLGQWFEAERRAGLAQATESMRLLATVPDPLRTDTDVEAMVAAGAPVNTWARDFANNLRLWRRKGTTDAELTSLIVSAKNRSSGTAAA